MGKSDEDASAGDALLISLTPASQSVSAMSSLLREVQAALREAARATPDTARLFEGDQSPVLTVRFEQATESVSLRFEFADASTRSPLGDVTAAVAKRFIAALGEQLKRRPQRTLWGRPAIAGRRKAVDADREPLAERASVVLAELGRSPAASVSGAGRRIRIEGETAEIL